MNVDDIAALCNRARRVGDGKYLASCPAHDDSSPSLSIRQSGDRVLVFCHAGCSFDAITNALGLDPQDMFEDRNLPAEARAAREQRELQAAAFRNRNLANWARLIDLGRELRTRDETKIEIQRRVAALLMSFDEAAALLAPIYNDYAAMDAEWWQLLERVRKQ